MKIAKGLMPFEKKSGKSVKNWCKLISITLLVNT